MTIRRAQPDEFDALVALWLEASLRAHDLVPAAFWRAQAPARATQYLPNARVWVYERAGAVAGVLAQVEQHLAALFVRPDAQGQGLARSYWPRLYRAAKC